MRVLLVEDTDDLRSLFARMLKLHGFEVREAANGCQALDCLLDYHPDLIITDLSMPMMDGYELIRRLREMPTMVDLPVVAITANESYEAENKARDAGAADFIVKPVDIPTLIDRLFGIGESARLRGRAQ